MWVFSRGGFCSARAAANGKVSVRFRTMRHARHFAALCGVETVEVSDLTDYRYRFEVSREVFADAVSREAMSIDYPNFKASVPHDDENYVKALHDVWYIHYSMQQRERGAK